MVDEHRRWGAQCHCHEAERRADSSVVCSGLSRGLHDAPGANAVFLARVESRERLLNPDEVEGSQALLFEGSGHCATIQVGCHRHDEVAVHFSRLRHVLRRPKRHCGWPEQAKLTRTILSLVKSDLVKIAAGDVSKVPQDLVAKEAIMQRVPLSSQASEGGHRQTRLVKVRAPASAIPWILASAREHQNIERVRSWAENENPDAAAAFDFEWMNAKRIAQLRHSQKKKYRPVLSTWTDVCAWMCRLQRWRLTDWSWVILGTSASRSDRRSCSVILLISGRIGAMTGVMVSIRPRNDGRRRRREMERKRAEEVPRHHEAERDLNVRRWTRHRVRSMCRRGRRERS